MESGLIVPIAAGFGGQAGEGPLAEAGGVEVEEGPSDDWGHIEIVDFFVEGLSLGLHCKPKPLKVMVLLCPDREAGKRVLLG